MKVSSSFFIRLFLINRTSPSLGAFSIGVCDEFGSAESGGMLFQTSSMACVANSTGQLLGHADLVHTQFSPETSQVMVFEFFCFLLCILGILVYWGLLVFVLCFTRIVLSSKF